jgi:alkylresorcinol/alkylpyrone synthase
MNGGVVAALAHAVPGAPQRQDALWVDYFGAHYGFDERAERIWLGAGVETRHGVIDPRVEDVAQWGTGARMQRYVTEGVPLGKEAVSSALARAGISAEDVGLFVVASCTGYATPGLDIVLARDLGMSDSVRRLLVGHMGCYAAIPALSSASDYVAVHGRPAVVLCCELPSLHVQAPTLSRTGGLTRAAIGQVVAHALFADAAAVAVLLPGADGLCVVDVEAKTDVATADHMSWDVTDHGFRMGLSPRVPDVLAHHVRPVVEALLRRNGMKIGDVAGWAVHPGGTRILEVAADRLGLAGGRDGDLAASYEVLRGYGNCSSATVLLVLEELLARRPELADGPVVALAFGPGLTLYAALLDGSAVTRSNDQGPR